MKLNEMVCPTCGHKMLTDCAYVTCDSCQTFFYASHSANVKPWAPPPLSNVVRVMPGSVIIRPVWVQQ